jgi:uncharacterized protein (DUF1501 family)
VKLNRRDFIRNAAFTAAAIGLRPIFGGKSSVAQGANTDKVVVVVNLFGGNDGLNTLIPLSTSGQSQFDKYKQLRPSLWYNQPGTNTPNHRATLPVTGQPAFGWNPEMTAFKQLWDLNKLAIINGVSVPTYAVGKYDHEAGQNEFQTCDVRRNILTAPTGWLGRYLDSVPVGQVTPGIDLGGGGLMLTGNTHIPVSISSISDFKLQAPSGSSSTSNLRNAYNAVQSHTQSDPVAETNRVFRQQAFEQSQTIDAATKIYCNANDNPQPCEAAFGNYPDTWFGFQMREAARIIRADMGVRAIGIGLGGYDTHSGQNTVVDTPWGNLPWHEYLMRSVCESIKALYDDLVAWGHNQRVLIVTISEFGRTVYENTDDGTDHGFGSSAFVIGDMVKGKDVGPDNGMFGVYPSLFNLFQGDSLNISNDFRNVYATVISNFFGADPSIVDLGDAQYNPAPIPFI